MNIQDILEYIQESIINLLNNIMENIITGKIIVIKNGI